FMTAVHVCGPLCGRHQPLRRHAAIVEAFAAHFSLLNQYGRHTEQRGGRGRGQSGRSGTDYTDVRRKLFRHPAKPCFAKITADQTRRQARRYFMATGNSANSAKPASAAINSGVTTSCALKRREHSPPPRARQSS